MPFVDLTFLIFHQGLRDMIDLSSDFSSGATRYESLKFLIFHQGPLDLENQKS